MESLDSGEIKMDISLRLKTIAKEVAGKTVADIATDHAYIPIYLCNQKSISKAIASDVNKAPLERAKYNICSYSCQDKIETRLGYGLEKIAYAEVESIVIAGVGGCLIVEILEREPEKTKSFKQLVIQPQSDIYKVRKCLHKIGFEILDEHMVYEDGKFYTIINCESRGSEVQSEYSEVEYTLGKILIQRKDKVLSEYLKAEMQKYENIMSKSPDLQNDLENGLHNIKQKYEVYKEVYEYVHKST